MIWLVLLLIALAPDFKNCPAIGGDVIVGITVDSSQQVPLEKIDHSAWDKLLKKHVDDRGMVNYQSWQDSPADVQLLDQYLAHLSHSNGQGTKEQQLAFWINAYNAVTIKGILREYPTTSIRNHTAMLIGYNIWKNLKLVVGDEQFSLDEIEHQILRKMNEPRIHFAIVCASIGCPRLLNEAYTAERMEVQLAGNARHFFADPQKFRYDASRQTFYVSPILDWFGADFGDSTAARLKAIAPYISHETAAQAAAEGTGSMSFVEYDWGLNDRK